MGPLLRHRRATRAGLAAALGAVLLVCGCGGGASTTAQDRRFVEQARAVCFGQLRPRQSSLNFANTQAPDDSKLAAASVGLRRAATEISNMKPPFDERAKQRRIAVHLEAAANAIASYLHDRVANVSATSADWRGIVEQVSQLDQVASRVGLRECGIPVVR